MYTKLKKYIAACCACLLVSFFMGDAKAAVASEGETESTASGESLNPGTIDLDVPAYLVRYLYREPDADEVANKRWYEGWGMMLYWNPDFLPYQTAYADLIKNRLGMSVKGLGFAISKDFNKHSGIRIGANYSSVSAYDNHDQTGMQNDLKRFNVSIDYLWNLSNTYYGYDLHRTDEWLLTAGFKGGRMLTSGGDLFGSVNLGLQYRKNIANDMSFFIEPQFAFFSDQYDNLKNEYEIDPGLNLLVGLYFRLGNPKMQILEEQNQILQNSFFQIYGGSVTGSTTYPFKVGMSQSKDYTKNHMNFGFNIGSWLNPSLAIRMGYFENIMGIGASSYRQGKGYGPTSRQTYRGGRLEFVLNPLMIMTNKTSLGRFGWDVSVGYEGGIINKHKANYNNLWEDDSDPNANHKNYFANGFTFGTQFKYYMSDHYAFFLDGRISNPMYSAKAADGLTASGDLSEKYLSWAIGMEYYLSTFDRYTRFSRGDNHEARIIDRLPNNNRWYYEMAAGLGEVTHWGENFKARRSFTGALAVGVNYNDYHGLRMRGALTRKFLHNWNQPGVTPLIPGDTYQITLGLDYMLNLTNLWWGKDEDNTRWSDINVFAGPTIQIAAHDLRNSLAGRNVFGAEVGAQFTRRISRGLDFFVEPRYEYNVHMDEGQLYSAGNRWNVLAGVKMYQFREKNHQYRDSVANHDKESWFLEVAGGAGFDVTGEMGTMKTRIQNPDKDGRIGFGYRINPISSVRFNALYSLFDESVGQNNGSRGFEFSMDYMVNVLNLWYGNNPHRRVNLLGYGGAIINPDGLLTPECTKDIAYDWRLGVQIGGQLVYSAFDNVSLFVEPRVSYYISDYITKSGSEFDKPKRDEHFDVFAGLIFYNQPGRFMERGYKTTEPDSARFWYYEMAGGISFTPSGHIGSTSQAISPSGYLGIGYYLNNRSSVRSRLSLVRILHPENDGYRDKFITGASVDYLYNMTNAVMGVNPYRRFDVSFFGGPVAEYYNSKNYNPLRKHPNYKDIWDFGFNFGSQLAWHANNYLDFFGEVRDVMSYREHHTRYEALAGVRLLQNKTKTIMYQDSAAQHAYNWFIEAAGGAGMEFTEGRDYKNLDGTGKIGVGYRFNKISSLRMTGAAWARQDKEDLHKHFGRGEFSFDYMANLLNLWYGVDPYRRFNLRGYFGPTLVVNNFTSVDDNLELNAGWNGGLQLSYSVSDNVDILLEPRMANSITGRDKARGDVYAGLIFYNQRGKLSANDYKTVNVDAERGWYLELAGGASFAPDGRVKGINSHVNPLGDVAIGRYFSNYSSLRAHGSLAYSSDYQNAKENRKWIPEVSLDYIHNITNHMLGVNPYRRFDFSLFAGPIAQVGGILSGNFSPDFGVNGGAQLSWHMNNFVDIFAEPRVSYLFNDEYYSRFQGLLGVRLYQNKTNNAQYFGEDPRHANTWFLETAAGLGSQVINQTNPDQAYKLAFGYRYNPYSSLRFSAMGWARKNNSNRGRNYAYNAAISADYMANIQNILYGVNPYRRFNLRGYIGGVLCPDNFLAVSDVHFLLGAQAGLQGSYAITENIDFMVEPRLEKYLNGGHDPRFDVYAGLIFYNQRGMMINRGKQPTDIDDKNTWFMEMGGGFSFSPDGRKDGGVTNHIDKDIQVALGIHLNNFSSLRGRANMTFVDNPRQTVDRRTYLPELALDYMYNVTNGIMGINPYRRFDINLFAGPTARVTGLRSGSWKFNWGVDGGAQAAWHINDSWDLVGEGRLLVGKNFSSRLAAIGGFAYRFSKSNISAASFDFQSDKLYTQVLLGGQMFNIENINIPTIDIKSYTSMPSINYNLGYRFNKLLAIQGGLYTSHISVDGKKGSDDAYTYGVRGEVVANVINLFKPSYDYNASKFNVTASAGFQTGRTRYENNDAKYGAGITAAAQAQYRVFSHSWALFELRAQAMKAKNAGMTIPVTAQIGMMYDFQNTETSNNTASKMYVQGGYGTFESKVGSMEFGAGYDFTPVHGLRLTFNTSLDDADQAGKWKSLSPDYVCNLTNMFFGNDDDKRHVDFSLLVGGDILFMSNKAADGSTTKKNGFGWNAGAQVTYNINKNWQIYTEPRVMFNGKDKDEDFIKHEGLDFQATVGLKYRLPEIHFTKK